MGTGPVARYTEFLTLLDTLVTKETFMHRAALTIAFLAISLLTSPAHSCVRNWDDIPKAGKLAEYYTIIDAADLVNSRGTRLSDFRQVLQQDRYNAHEADGPGGVWLDDGFSAFDLDPYFDSLARRSRIVEADYSLTCPESLTGIARQIERGQVPGVLAVHVFRGPDDRLRILLWIVG